MTIRTYTAREGISELAMHILHSVDFLEDRQPASYVDLEWVRVKPPRGIAPVVASPTTGRTHLRNVPESTKLFTLSDIDQDILGGVYATSEVAIYLLTSVMRVCGVDRTTNRPGTCIYGKSFYITDRNGRVAGHIREKMIAYHAVETDTLGTADIIFISEKYRNQFSIMFAEEGAPKLKNGVYIVNTSRSEMVDHNKLIDMMQSGMIAGYGEDVTNRLYPPHWYETLFLGGYSVAYTNHLGGFTKESLETVEVALVEKVVEWFSTKP